MTPFAIKPGKTPAQSLDRQVARDVVGWRIVDDEHAWSLEHGTIDLTDWRPSERLGFESFAKSEIFPTPEMILRNVRGIDAARVGVPRDRTADPELRNVVPMRFR